VTASLVKITVAGQANSLQGGIPPQYFIGVNNETLSVVAVRIDNPRLTRSPNSIRPC